MEKQWVERNRRRAKFLVSLLILTSVPVLACIWDSDTIDDELRGVPEAAVLATGRWYRHGQAYYEERVLALGSKESLTLEEFDDLAVAYERLGRREEALKALKRKLRKLQETPNREHQYRYHANKGTILAHLGRFDEAVRELNKALEINPDAHFGRERYQIDLIRYVAAAKKNPELWSEHNFLSWAGYESGWPTTLLRPSNYRASFEAAKRDDTADAFQAIAGMLRFGGLEGPELYRALGDLSLAQQNLNLAWLFYLKALDKGHPAQEEIEASVQVIEEHWKEAGYSDHPTRDQYRESQENAARWLEAFQRIEAESLQQPKSVPLEEMVARANDEVPQAPLGGSNSPLWVGVGTLVLALLIFQNRKRLFTR